MSATAKCRKAVCAVMPISLSCRKALPSSVPAPRFKNLNSFRALVRAIEYEVERQIDLVESGGHVVQETRTWDDAQGMTLSMRSKRRSA